MKRQNKKIEMLRGEFSAWWAASLHCLSLDELSKGKAKATLRLTNVVLTPHPMPMVNGLMITTMASMVGVYAVKTLINDEYPILKTCLPPKLLEPSVPGEKALLIETCVTNNREARKDTIIVNATIKNLEGRLKAKCVFYYRIISKEKIEPKLKSLGSADTTPSL